MATILVFTLGLFIGSFLNVLADRWSAEEGIGGRSHCEFCKHTLSAIDLIPLISFLILGGRCRYCKKKLSWYYPIVEIVTGLAFVFTFLTKPVILNPDLIGMKDLSRMRVTETSSEILRFAQNDTFVIICLLSIVSSLIVIFFADLKYHIIPDEAIVTMTVFSLPIVLLSNKLPSSIIGAIVLSILIGLLYILTRGRGMGFGDVKYAAAMGFLLGPLAGLIGLYIAFLSGAVVSIVAIVFDKKALKSKIAFGPFLVLGTILMIFYSSEITNFVSQVFNM